MLLCSSLAICTLAAMPIERVLREYQAKYHFVWSTKNDESKKASAPYVEWPAGYNGPAPHFPPDGFYGDLDKDPDMGVIVVSALQGVFRDDHNGVYFYYAKGTSSDQLAGDVAIVPYRRGDFPALDATPDRGTYAGVLSSLASYVQSLKYFSVTALTLRDCARHYGDSPRCCSSGAAEGAAASVWLASSWNPEMCLPEMYVMQQVLPPGQEQCPDIPNYTLNLEATRACLVASVPGSHEGKYTWFLRVQAEPEGWGNNTPPVPADGVYHAWGGPQEAGSECVSAMLADGQPNVGSWPGPDAQFHVRGWEVLEFSAVFEPSYDDHPEPGSCCSSCNAGATTIRCDSLFMSIGFGVTKFGKSAGFLMLKEQAPSVLSATPENLRYCAYSDGSARLSWNGAAQLSQIVAGEVAVNINIKGTNSYELGLYHANQVTSNSEWLFDGSTRYSLSGIPFKTVSITNLNQSANQIRITELDNGVSTVSDFNWTHSTVPGAGTWTLSRAGSLVQEQSQTSFNTNDHTRTEARWIKDSSNNVIYQESTTYHLYDWGERIVQKTVGSGTNALTTQWTIYDAPSDGANFGEVKTAVYPGGRWEYNAQYNAMRPTMVFGPLGNQPVPASGTNLLFSSGACTVNSYSGSCNSTTEYRNGVPVALRYRSFPTTAGYYLDEVCLRTNASPGNLDNLKTTTQRDMTSDVRTFGQMQFRQAPDGTVEITSGTLPGSGHLVTTTLTGAWDRVTGISHGRMVVTETDDAGNVWSRKVYDISPPGPVSTLVEEAEYSQPDPDYGRPQRGDYNAGPYKGLYELTTYGCCGVYSHTDVEGIQTQYSYDVLKRQTADTRNDILHTNVLDAAGQVLATYVKAGTTNRLIAQTAYDLAGRVVSEINALGAVITHGEGFTNISGTTMWPRTVTTGNNADQGSRQEGYYCDGRLFEVTGAATTSTF